MGKYLIHKLRAYSGPFIFNRDGFYLLDGYFFGVECCRNDGVKTIGWNSFNPSEGLAGFWQRMELGAILHNMLIEQLGHQQGFLAADYIRACYVT